MRSGLFLGKELPSRFISVLAWISSMFGLALAEAQRRLEIFASEVSR
jgi:hypothetical protein